MENRNAQFTTNSGPFKVRPLPSRRFFDILGAEIGKPETDKPRPAIEKYRRMNSPTPSKSELRALMRRRLSSLGPVLPREIEAVWENVRANVRIRGAISQGTAMGYAEMPDEIPVFGQLLGFADAFSPPSRPRPVPIAIPYLLENDLEPILVHSEAELAPRQPYGIREPLAELCNLPGRISGIKSLQLIIIPGLAFDEQGRRLGRGKGFYDRFLARLFPQTLLIALAREAQIVPKVPTEPHDKSVDFVVTEKRCIACRPENS